MRTLDNAFNHQHDPNLMPQQDLPEILEGDSVRLQQVLVNLTKNALKYAPSGSINIYMAFESRDNKLIVHVQDNGKGIKDTKMPMLFKMFGSVRLDAEDKYDGIGFGLHISKNIINRNGGKI